jgi:hypothetical protein
LAGEGEEDSLIRIIKLMFGRRKWVRRIGRGKDRFTKIAGHGWITHRLRTKRGHKIFMEGEGSKSLPGEIEDN